MWTLSIVFSVATASIFSPEQVHIAWGEDDTQMTVTWAADYPSVNSMVEYTPVLTRNETVKSFLYSNQGTWSTFSNEANPKVLTRQLHTCKSVMKNLVPGTFYKYRVGSEAYGWSDTFCFQAKRNVTGENLVRFLVYGDLGIGEQIEATMFRLIEETYNYEYDAVIHDGDFAYDLSSFIGTYGDQFLRSIEPVASRIPYMTSQGNHEAYNNLLHYYNRFYMKGNTSNLWYSFNHGRAHFLAYSSEFLFIGFNESQAAQQAFIEQDLASYDREKYPWLIVYGHRPPYCSANMTAQYGLGEDIPIERHNGDCLVSAPMVRGAFEDLWYNNKVDLMISGHVHAYERFTAVYQNHSMPCQYEDLNTYVNPSAPVYVITGTPGQQESYAPDSPTPLPFSVVQDDHLGYSRLTIFNSTHLLWEQVRSVTSEIVDYFWIIKESNQVVVEE